jgi:hypothetical protein
MRDLPVAAKGVVLPDHNAPSAGAPNHKVGVRRGVENVDWEVMQAVGVRHCLRKVHIHCVQENLPQSCTW